MESDKNERALRAADVMACLADELVGRATKRGEKPSVMTVRKDSLRKAIADYRKARHG